MNRATRNLLVQACVAIVGTGVAFAFLEAGGFRSAGVATLQRMVAPAGLQSAALGAGITAVLLVPVVLWQVRRLRRHGAAS